MGSSFAQKLLTTIKYDRNIYIIIYMNSNLYLYNILYKTVA